MKSAEKCDFFTSEILSQESGKDGFGRWKELTRANKDSGSDTWAWCIRGKGEERKQMKENKKEKNNRGPLSA